jgi:hypothetical protein
MRSVIMLSGHDFQYVQSLIPERDASGAIKEVSPQGRYAMSDAVQLHKHGHGAFCKFSISVPRGLGGIYALVMDGAVRYIGECEDLGKRFNAGYGNISPRNCYVGGQMTNCKINRRVLDATKAGSRADLYFYPTQDGSVQRRTVEKELVARYSPPWND